MMFGNEKSAEQRQKEKERRKRGTRKYGRAKFKNSRKGTISCISGAGAIFILAGCILYAFIARGEAAGIVGGIVIITFLLSIWGIRCAIQGFRERDRSYLTCKIGLPVNAVALIIFLAIFIGGLN